jgi:hypothetical protein
LARVSSDAVLMHPDPRRCRLVRGSLVCAIACDLAGPGVGLGAKGRRSFVTAEMAGSERDLMGEQTRILNRLRASKARSAGSSG